MKAVSLPKKDRKTGKIIGIYWSFTEYNPKKQRNDRIPVDQIPKHIRDSQDPKEVDEYCRSQNAINDAAKFRSEQRHKWETQFHNFSDLLVLFENVHKRKAKNSWKTDVHWLKSYVFHYFLTVAKVNNLNNWHFEFSRFKLWLETVKPLK